VPRTVLEWRLDPEGEWRSPYAPGLDTRVVVICDHGYSSSFAAASLVDLGYERCGDVVGGFDAWCEGGLPVARAPARRAPGERPGMGPPDPSA
jgi:rhodanese-related sulfurtransferase